MIRDLILDLIRNNEAMFTKVILNNEGEAIQHFLSMFSCYLNNKTSNNPIFYSSITNSYHLANLPDAIHYTKPNLINSKQWGEFFNTSQFVQHKCITADCGYNNFFKFIEDNNKKYNFTANIINIGNTDINIQNYIDKKTFPKINIQNLSFLDMEANDEVKKGFDEFINYLNVNHKKDQSLIGWHYKINNEVHNFFRNQNILISDMDGNITLRKDILKLYNEITYNHISTIATYNKNSTSPL